jgi:hypothetical protein
MNGPRRKARCSCLQGKGNGCENRTAKEHEVFEVGSEPGYSQAAQPGETRGQDG